MKKDIILAGVGGQGILSIAAIIGTAAVKAGLFLKQAEVHGMSQRGGDVQSNLRISDEPIASDLIPIGKADLIISIEPMEALRYVPMLSSEGWIITNTTPFINIPDYPAKEAILGEIGKQPGNVILDAEAAAKKIGSVKCANVVILGAATPFLGLSYYQIEDAIRVMFGRKGEDVVKMNLDALKAGSELAKQQLHQTR
ncbi:MAG: indolepyruvate oxidoreductase subunit beta [Bacteroidota bacterium]|nr:indolepyruvate oxidoreductase subunit beta [Bacteroidota bacterium]